MKNFLITVSVVVAACGVAFGAFYAFNENEAMHRAARDGDAMAWLRVEFQLNDAQFAAIEKLHEDYGVVCTEHCAMITNARRLGAPADEIVRLEGLCVAAMTTHFRRVAALMPAAQGERYLATVLPRIPGYGHAGAPDLQGAH